MNNKKSIFITFVFILYPFFGHAQLLLTVKDTVYYDINSAQDPYIKERCRLDIYAPKDSKGKPTVIFLHGGGLTTGDKYIPWEVTNNGLIGVAATYRFSPKVKCPVYIEDAAAAVAWVYKNIEQFGGDRKKIYITGQSAGAYLTALIALDKSYLAKFGIDADSIAGFIPISGQMTTHFTILNEKGIAADSGTDIVDTFAPLHHIRKMNVPFLFIIGDRSLDMVGRYKQNWDIVKKLRPTNPQTALWELRTKDHATVTVPALSAFSRLIAKDSLAYIKDSLFFDSSLSLRNIYDSKAIKEVRVYNMQGQEIPKEDAYSRTNETLIWKSVDTSNRVTTRKILKK